MDSIPLSMLQAGDWAVVNEIVGQPPLVQRLAEMGLRPGAELEMVRHGDPCMIRIAGQPLPLGLRADAETHILVAPLRTHS
ncbi:MAG TPA: FeoA family protein [Pirellulales bacterium]